MSFQYNSEEHHQSRLIGFFQIFLLLLIIAGMALLATQNRWVPPLTNYILSTNIGTRLFPPVHTSAISRMPTRAGKVDTGVEGIVMIGPTCPVVRYPDDGSCADKPYQTTLVISNPYSSDSNSGISVSTDEDGYFSQELAPGMYIIRAQSETAMRHFNPFTFEVKLHQRVSLTLKVDSGIR